MDVSVHDFYKEFLSDKVDCFGFKLIFIVSRLSGIAFIEAAKVALDSQNILGSTWSNFRHEAMSSCHEGCQQLCPEELFLAVPILPHLA